MTVTLGGDRVKPEVQQRARGHLDLSLAFPSGATCGWRGRASDRPTSHLQKQLWGLARSHRMEFNPGWRMMLLLPPFPGF